MDVGTRLISEVSGFEVILAGARERAESNDPLLAELAGVLDSRFSHFSNQPQFKTTRQK